MTEQSLTITTAPLPDPGTDYVVLRDKAVQLVQQMAGDTWTDFNASDPGVTILEQLCYALTELSYRADYPVADLLCDPATGKLSLGPAGLYLARAIMPVNPVTTNDFRRLLIDRVPGLGNVWLTRCPTKDTDGVNGLYKLALHVPSQDPCCRSAKHDHEHVRSRALATYRARRALCEDVHGATVLKLLNTRVSATVQLDAAADAATVLAALMFRLGMLFAPEPRRQSLDSLVAAGQSTAEIFDGPLMLRGFIADDQLTALPRSFLLNDVLETMAATDGVVAVNDLQVIVEEDQPIAPAPGEIDVPEDCLLWLTTAPQDGRFAIRLYRDAVECRPDADQVAALLDGLWAAQRRTYPLWGDYGDTYAAPTGRQQDLSVYTSVQDQFPNAYGIGPYGVPYEATPARRGQAKQLKGYLLVFDQLMADYFAQLAFLRELFSTATGGKCTYAVQSLAPIVPNVKPLLRDDYMPGLQLIAAAADPVESRQSAILDLMLSLYAEHLNAPPHAGCTSGSDGDGTPLLRAKRALLARTVRATRDRGRAFDYSKPDSERNSAGLEILSRIELGIVDAASGADGSDGAFLVDDPAQATFGRLLPPDLAAHVQSSFLPIGSLLDDETADTTPSPLAGQRVAAKLLPALAAMENYRIGSAPDESEVALVCRDADNGWWLIGRYHAVAAAVAVAGRLVRKSRRRQLHIVEHTLLRFAQMPAESDVNRYTFRISAIVATHDEEARDAAWRDQVTAIVRRNSPAHIVVECLFLNHEQFKRFWARYRPWLEALRDGPSARLTETSRRLEHFLRTHRDGMMPLES